MKAKKQSSGPSVSKQGVERFYRIDSEIASGKFPNTPDLAKICEVSTATISRDIDFMRDRLDAPIEYDSFNGGYYYTKKTYRVPGGFVGAEDILALGMAKSILTLYRETPLFEAANRLLESIIAPIASDGNKGRLENRILVPKIASAKVKSEIWDPIITALKKNQIITFQYISIWEDDHQSRRVRPFQLLFGSGMWYLYGFSEERKAERIFALSRMQNVELTPNFFTLPKNFSYDDWSGDSYFGVFIGQEKYHFAIDCYGSAVVFASERKWAADQKITEIKGGVKLEFNSTQFDTVLRWVLSAGSSVIPREPKPLVDEWKRQIKEMSKLISDKR